MCQNENKAKYKGKFHHTLISGKTTHYTPFEKFKSMVHRGKIKKETSEKDRLIQWNSTFLVKACHLLCNLVIKLKWPKKLLI